MQKSMKIRFLLTGRCTARCKYCHNEGQSKPAPMLSLQTINYMLAELEAHNLRPQEIILSGGEPTLHKELAAVAKRCKETGAYLSMNSHGGHPERLLAALPYLDELKLHVDSFHPRIQMESMGIPLDKVRESIALSQQHHVRILANHPVQDWASARHFIRAARIAGIDCKLIDLLGQPSQGGGVDRMPWRQEGYIRVDQQSWLHVDGEHRMYTRQCGAEFNAGDGSLFVGTDGIRRSLEGPVIGYPENFSVARLMPDIEKTGQPLNHQSCRPNFIVRKWFPKQQYLPTVIHASF